jgi:hypothetical protein
VQGKEKEGGGFRDSMASIPEIEEEQQDEHSS